MTPMQRQYNDLKDKHADAILLFRLGDFYEAFNEDAEIISNVLGITLTGREKEENRIPMAGIPHHALKNYLPKLIENGLKVAIADQVEEAVQGQLVDRQVTRIITAGTIIDEDSLERSKNNYIASVIFENNTFYIAFADITTGIFNVFETQNSNIAINEIKKINPSEILINKDNPITKENFFRIEVINEWDINENYETLLNHFKVKTLEGFGFESNDKTINAAGELLRYIKNNHKTDLSHIISIQKYNYSDYMQLDDETIRNLELLYPLHTSGSQKATVFSILNKCMTSMGQRLLRHWIINPLIKKEYLIERLDSVHYFF